MKHTKILDAAVAAALLLAHVPGLAERILPDSTPAALILPAPETQHTQDDSAEKL